MQTGTYCFTERRFFFILLFFQCTHCPNFKIKYSISSWIFPKKNFEKRNEPFHYILKITIYRKSQVVFTVLGRKFVPYRLWSGFAVFFFSFFFFLPVRVRQMLFEVYESFVALPLISLQTKDAENP
jgi:hypothetical protein